MFNALSHLAHVIRLGEMRERRDRFAVILAQVADIKRRQLPLWWRWSAYLAAGVAADRLVGNLR